MSAEAFPTTKLPELTTSSAAQSKSADLLEMHSAKDPQPSTSEPFVEEIHLTDNKFVNTDIEPLLEKDSESKSGGEPSTSREKLLKEYAKYKTVSSVVLSLLRRREEEGRLTEGSINIIKDYGSVNTDRENFQYLPHNYCVQCFSGQYENYYPPLAICLALACCPIGFICCIMMKKQKCNCCGYIE